MQAAAVVAIFISSYYIHDYMNKGKSNIASTEVEVIEEQKSSENEQLQELIEAEAYYSAIINSKQMEFKLATSSYPEIQQDLEIDFA